MHNFEQVKDVIHYGKETHAGLHNLYSTINTRNQQARVGMLLDFLSLHELQREQGLAAFEQGGDAHVLDTWMQYAPSIDIGRQIDSTPINAGMSVDDVIGLVINFNNSLMELYREAAMETDIPSARAVFDNLRCMEGKEKMKVVRDAMLLQDI